MRLEETIAQVQEKLRKGQFPSEATVSNGAVLPILYALDWPVFGTSVVSPEYTVEGRRVDYALCRSSGQPVVFLEVKRVGIVGSGERQLFEYAFHRGVPLAVLTDGQEWNFYLPAGEGDYQDRRVYKLDLLERDLSECLYRLSRYLSYSDVASGIAFENAQADYKDANREREIERTMPQAWNTLLNEAGESLVEILADKVADLCGYKPDTEICEAFLSAIVAKSGPSGRPSKVQVNHTSVLDSGKPLSDSQPTPIQPRRARNSSFILHGQQHECKSAIEVLTSIFERLTDNDPAFPSKFASRKHGAKNRYLAQDKYELHPDKDFCDTNSRQLNFGWFINTDVSNRTKIRVIKLACEVAGLEFGRDLIVNLD